jgi:hypothetical protein
MRILVRCALFALLACTVPLPYFPLSKGLGVVPFLVLVLLAVMPDMTETRGVVGIVIGLLQALVWATLLWAMAGYAQKRFVSVSDTGRVIAALALVALAFSPIYTTPGEDTPWTSAVALQGWVLLLAALSTGATM